jgi:hypothetical protein
MASGLRHPASTLFLTVFAVFLALFSLSSGRSSHEVRKAHSFIFKYLTCSIFKLFCFQHWVGKSEVEKENWIDGVRKMEQSHGCMGQVSLPDVI